MEKYVMMTVIGTSDPIKNECDGPMLHIVREYHPELVLMLASGDVLKDEQENHYNERAIGKLSEEIGFPCKVELVSCEGVQANNYDEFTLPFLKAFHSIKERYPYPEFQCLMNASSGAPQMTTAMCMIAISDSQYCKTIQIPFRTRAWSRGFYDLEAEFAGNTDHKAEFQFRGEEPKLMNFKRPVLQREIESLIENFDYAGAGQVYENSDHIFNEIVGNLIKHAEKRVKLEDEEAKKIAERAGVKEELYFVPDSLRDVHLLVEYFNSMKIKQARGELSDFVLRMEVFTEYLGLYIIEAKLGLKKEDFCSQEVRRNNIFVYKLDREKCNNVLPGLEQYFNQQFRTFRWGEELSARFVVHIVSFASKQSNYRKLRLSECAAEMLKWLDVIRMVRNPAAHTIVATTEEKIKQFYGNKSSETLVLNMGKVLRVVFGTQVNCNQAFDVYKTINRMIREEMEK